MKAFVLILFTVLAINAAAQTSVEVSGDALSGERILPACKEYLKAKPAMGPAEIYCGTAIMTILAAGNFSGAYLVCPPQGVTVEQGIRIVVMALETYPAVQHNDFIRLAIYTLNKTWPCAKPTQDLRL